MLHPEMFPGAEPAPLSDVRIFYETASYWMTKNGEYFYEPKYEVLGTHKGLALLETNPIFRKVLNLSDLKELAHEAVLQFSISGDVEIIFSEACYAPAFPEEDEEHVYLGPKLSFDMPQPANSTINELRLSIDINYENELETTRIEEPRSRPKPEPGTTSDDRFQRLVEQARLEQATGFNLISIDEFNSLKQIFEAAKIISARNS